MKLNSNTLKYLGAAAMLTDHIAMCFFPVATPLGFIMRTLGRLTAPIMFTLFADSFKFTKSKKDFGIRLFIFALISQIPYALIHYQSFYEPDYNVIATFFLSFLMLLCYEKIKNPVLKYICVAGILALSRFCDWGIVGPMWTLAAFLCDTRKKRIVGFTLVSAYHIVNQFAICFENDYHIACALCQMGVLLFIPLYLCCNGQKGKRSKFSKWFFYCFYPLHLLVLYFATM